MKKLDTQKANKIIALYGKGLYRVSIAAVIGVLEETIVDWQEYALKVFTDDCKGKDIAEEDHIYLDFYRDFSAAEAKVEEKLVNAWQEAGKDDWKAAKDFLATRYPNRWNPKKSIELNATVKAEVKTDLSAISTEDLANILAILDKSEEEEQA